MKPLIAKTLRVFVPFLFFGCGGQAPEPEVSAESVQPAESYANWIEWAEKSGNGLWEAGSHRFTLSQAQVYGGDDFPPFYNVEGFSIQNSTMYAADPSDNSLAAVDVNTGEQLWKTGEQGEGPGHFNGIGEVAAFEGGIAVCDMGNNRIALLSLAGEFLEYIPIQCPFDVMWNEDTLYALSLAESAPLNIYSSQGEFIRSCGELPEELDFLAYFNRHLHGMIAEDGSVLVVSRFVPGIWRIDPSTGTTELFAETAFPQGEMHNDLQSGGFMVLCRDIFTGPDHMINVILPVFTENGGRLSDGGEMMDLTAVHRYNRNGEYLDSWVMEGTVGIALMYEGKLYTADRYAHGTVVAHDVIR